MNQQTAIGGGSIGAFRRLLFGKVIRFCMRRGLPVSIRTN